jgi:hypothetical protein
VSASLTQRGGQRKATHPVDEVAEVVEQFRVVFGDKLLPDKDRVARLGPVADQVVAPDVGRDANLRGRVAKDADVARLGELARLVVEVLCQSKKEARRT